jgi:hypothetical protein
MLTLKRLFSTVLFLVPLCFMQTYAQEGTLYEFSCNYGLKLEALNTLGEYNILKTDTALQQLPFEKSGGVKKLTARLVPVSLEDSPMDITARASGKNWRDATYQELLNFGVQLQDVPAITNWKDPHNYDIIVTVMALGTEGKDPKGYYPRYVAGLDRTKGDTRWGVDQYWWDDIDYGMYILQIRN